MAHNRTKIDDAASSLAKVFYCFLCCSQKPANICVEHPVEVLVRESLDCCELIYSGIVHQHVYFAESIFSFCKDALNVCVLCNAALHGKRLAASLLDFLHDALGARF